MQAWCFLICALCLPSLGTCADADGTIIIGADGNISTINSTTTTTNTTTTSTLSTTTNTTSTINTSTTLTYTTSQLNATSTGNFSNDTSTRSFTTSSLTTTTTSEVVTTMANGTAITTSHISTTNKSKLAVAMPIADPNKSTTPMVATTTTTANYTDPNATENITELIIDLNMTMDDYMMTTTTEADRSTISHTTTFNGTTTKTKRGLDYTTTTTTLTTTLPKECEEPFDPHGNYTKEPFSFRDNSSWSLRCNDTYFPENGLTMAKCLGNGVMRPAGVCLKDGCNGNQATGGSGSTCQSSMSEGDTCTLMCPSKNQVLGYFTCLRAKLRGRPMCLKLEAKHWVVAWVLPKIVGGFDFTAKLDKFVNMTNNTISAFETNVSKSLAKCLFQVTPSHFDVFEVVHLAESSLDNIDDTTNHLFGVTYELIIWDVNTLGSNQEATIDLLEPGSASYECFVEEIVARANMTITEIFPTNYPITFNETVLAPDTEVSLAPPRWIDVRLNILLLILPNYLVHFLSALSREDQG